jgi:UDP-glucose 4-epimerase
MAVLVTGGAGFIGSVTVELLRAQGEQVVILDNLSRGHLEAVDEALPFYQGDVGDSALVQRITQEQDIESCIHFAAFAYVGESVAEPKRYFQNNVEQGIRLLDALLAANVRRVVFSSTCATYGEPQRLPIDETHPQQPTNPYGWTKFMLERVMEAYDNAYNLRFVALRYFNAAGAIATRGEDHEPEPHLIPNVLAAAKGKQAAVAIFGNDYPTPDGTCVRDYIHVADLGDAHIKALQYLRGGGDSTHINLGNGQGYSVLEVIEAARRVTGQNIEARMEPPRPGDPSRLVADASKAFRVLGWQPAYADIETMIRTAWQWHLANPQGYLAKDNK